jgi:hypothetical protein
MNSPAGAHGVIALLGTALSGVIALPPGVFDLFQRRRVFQSGCVAEFFAEIRGAHDAAHDFAFRVFGMSATKITSRGASTLPGWTANAFSKL